MDDSTHRLILIVDDDRLLRHLLADALSDEGYPVLLASHGGEGLALARERQPSLGLIDLMMPVMDGLTLIRALRADPRTSWMCLIAMSASTSLERWTAQIPVNATLGKPFDLDQLFAVVEQHLRAVRRPPLGPDPPARTTPAG